ncbi:hypothetical protein Tco_0704931 [Tanacetum coccineum]|uniref:Uncharacterized protein n=1 Tax=Tanacetum coccineum TaxID=301880 RepID=A0ABQ4Y336_9ASTR
MVFNSPCLTDKKELIHHEGTALCDLKSVVDSFIVCSKNYRVFNSPMLHLLRVEMVINSPWIMPLLGTKELASPEQTTTGSSMLRRHFDVQFNKYSSQELKKIAMLLATSISILKIQDEDLSGNWKINIGKFQFRYIVSCWLGYYHRLVLGRLSSSCPTGRLLSPGMGQIVIPG